MNQPMNTLSISSSSSFSQSNTFSSSTSNTLSEQHSRFSQSQSQNDSIHKRSSILLINNTPLNEHNSLNSKIYIYTGEPKSNEFSFEGGGYVVISRSNKIAEELNSHNIKAQLQLLVPPKSNPRKRSGNSPDGKRRKHSSNSKHRKYSSNGSPDTSKTTASATMSNSGTSKRLERIQAQLLKNSQSNSQAHSQQSSISSNQNQIQNLNPIINIQPPEDILPPEPTQPPIHQISNTNENTQQPFEITNNFHEEENKGEEEQQNPGEGETFELSKTKCFSSEHKLQQMSEKFNRCLVEVDEFLHEKNQICQEMQFSPNAEILDQNNTLSLQDSLNRSQYDSQFFSNTSSPQPLQDNMNIQVSTNNSNPNPYSSPEVKGKSRTESQDSIYERGSSDKQLSEIKELEEENRDSIDLDLDKMKEVKLFELNQYKFLALSNSQDSQMNSFANYDSHEKSRAHLPRLESLRSNSRADSESSPSNNFHSVTDTVRHIKSKNNPHIQFEESKHSDFGPSIQRTSPQSKRSGTNPENEAKTKKAITIKSVPSEPIESLETIIQYTQLTEPRNLPFQTKKTPSFQNYIPENKEQVEDQPILEDLNCLSRDDIMSEKEQYSTCSPLKHALNFTKDKDEIESHSKRNGITNLTEKNNNLNQVNVNLSSLLNEINQSPGFNYKKNMDTDEFKDSFVFKYLKEEENTLSQVLSFGMNGRSPETLKSEAGQNDTRILQEIQALRSRYYEDIKKLMDTKKQQSKIFDRSLDDENKKEQEIIMKDKSIQVEDSHMISKDQYNELKIQCDYLKKILGEKDKEHAAWRIKYEFLEKELEERTLTLKNCEECLRNANEILKLISNNKSNSKENMLSTLQLSSILRQYFEGSVSVRINSSNPENSNESFKLSEIISRFSTENNTKDPKIKSPTKNKNSRVGKMKRVISSPAAMTKIENIDPQYLNSKNNIEQFKSQPRKNVRTVSHSSQSSRSKSIEITNQNKPKEENSFSNLSQSGLKEKTFWQMPRPQNNTSQNEITPDDSILSLKQFDKKFPRGTSYAKTKGGKLFIKETSHMRSISPTFIYPEKESTFGYSGYLSRSNSHTPRGNSNSSLKKAQRIKSVSNLHFQYNYNSYFNVSNTNETHSANPKNTEKSTLSKFIRKSRRKESSARKSTGRSQSIEEEGRIEKMRTNHRRAGDKFNRNFNYNCLYTDDHPFRNEEEEEQKNESDYEVGRNHLLVDSQLNIQIHTNPQQPNSSQDQEQPENVQDIPKSPIHPLKDKNIKNNEMTEKSPMKPISPLLNKNSRNLQLKKQGSYYEARKRAKVMKENRFLNSKTPPKSRISRTPPPCRILTLQTEDTNHENEQANNANMQSPFRLNKSKKSSPNGKKRNSKQKMSNKMKRTKIQKIHKFKKNLEKCLHNSPSKRETNHLLNNINHNFDYNQLEKEMDSYIQIRKSPIIERSQKKTRNKEMDFERRNTTPSKLSESSSSKSVLLTKYQYQNFQKKNKKAEENLKSCLKQMLYQ